MKAMDPDRQLAITLSFMQAIAPVIARYHIRQFERHLNRPHLTGTGFESIADLQRQIAVANAKMTVEFSCHLTAQFTSLDAALNSTQTQNISQSQNPITPGEQGPGNPAAGVQPSAASVLEGTYPVHDLRGDRD